MICKTMKPYPSYRKMAAAIGLSVNTVEKAICELSDNRLIWTEHTSYINGHGLKVNGNNLSGGRGAASRGPDRAGYDLPSSLSSVEMDKIDADYLEEHFKLVVPILVGDEPDDEKDAKIREFESMLSALSAVQQEFAKQIIRDIRSGDLPVSGKTLRGLIAEYQARDEDTKCREFADSKRLP